MMFPIGRSSIPKPHFLPRVVKKTVLVLCVRACVPAATWIYDVSVSLTSPRTQHSRTFGGPCLEGLSMLCGRCLSHVLARGRLGLGFEAPLDSIALELSK
ncbi:hypothetical protein DFP73DRAFT_559433 [Morchella snyderi]|nr:hypothetical protein DFP73DRAFT_559433 [Morchella snyderi]